MTTATAESAPTKRVARKVATGPVKAAKTASKTAKTTTTTSTATTASEPATKPARAAKASPATAPVPRKPYGAEKDEHGYTIGSDMSIVAEEMIKGGVSRVEISDRVLKRTGNKTKTGTPKNIASMFSSILGALKEKGYTVDSYFALVPPAGKAAATTPKDAAVKVAFVPATPRKVAKKKVVTK